MIRRVFGLSYLLVGTLVLVDVVSFIAGYGHLFDFWIVLYGLPYILMLFHFCLRFVQR